MKSGKVRIALCWALAVLCIPLGLLITSALYALMPGTKTGLQIYLLNIPSELCCLALPAILIMAARPQRLARFRASARPLTSRIVGYTALFAVSATVVVSLIAALCGSFLESAFGYTAEAQPQVIPNGMGEWVLTLLCTAIVPAFAEELFFRGMLQGMLTKRLPRAGIWIAAFCFAALHRQWDALPALFMLGVMLGYTNVRHGFWAGVLMHGLYNAAAVVLSARSVAITFPVLILCAAAFAFSCHGLMKKEKTDHEADGIGL